MAAETTIMRPSSRSAVRPALLAHLVRTVRQQQMFVPGHHLLVAVSGGPDSVALLSLLHRLARSWRLTLTAVHCNYGLRGAESDGDESFVEHFLPGTTTASCRPSTHAGQATTALIASSNGARRAL